jgi:hypothetical protein
MIEVSWRRIIFKEAVGCGGRILTFDVWGMRAVRGYFVIL